MERSYHPEHTVTPAPGVCRHVTVPSALATMLIKADPEREIPGLAGDLQLKAQTCLINLKPLDN